MKEKFQSRIDITIPRRRYYSKFCGLTLCPECGRHLTEFASSVVFAAKSDTDEGEFISNYTGSHFCNSCPVVVFDSDKVEKAVRMGIRGDKNLKYKISGIVDMEAVPEEKRHLELGTEENPLPLITFLPDLSAKNAGSSKKTGRNDICPCGSGLKYKKCCG